MEEFEEISEVLIGRFEAINAKYIEIMAKHINAIGKLTASDMHALKQFQRMGRNVNIINDAIMRATNMTLNQLYKMYDVSGLRIYEGCAEYYKANKVEQMPFKQNFVLQNYISAYKQQTANTFYNMARSTIANSSYSKLLDMAITERTMGVATSEQALRGIVAGRQEKVLSMLNSRYGANISDKLMSEVLKQSRNGLRVYYNSGISRRLDSAVRMNLSDGMRQFNIQCKELIGRDFGADGVEIDAHGLCAKDHIDIQGRQYSIQKFNKINEELSRKIATCNCRHSINYIILGVSEPTYSKKDLKQMRDISTEQIKIGDKSYTRYECTQKLRQMETRMRYLKDDVVALRQFKGTEGAIKDKKARIKDIRGAYRETVELSGLEGYGYKASVPGYR